MYKMTKTIFQFDFISYNYTCLLLPCEFRRSNGRQFNQSPEKSTFAIS